MCGGTNCRRFLTGGIIRVPIYLTGAANPDFTVFADFIVTGNAGAALKIGFVVFNTGIDADLQRTVAGLVFAFLTFLFVNAGFIIVFAFKAARFADAGLAAGTFAPAVGAFAGFISINIAFIILTGADSDLIIAFALFGIFPVTGADFALVIFSAAAVGLGNAGRLFAARTAVIVVSPVFRQLVGSALAGFIFPVAGIADADIALSVTGLIIFVGAGTIRIKFQLGNTCRDCSVIIGSGHLLFAGAAGKHSRTVKPVGFIRRMTVAFFVISGSVADNAAAAEQMSDRTIKLSPFVIGGAEITVIAADIRIVAVFAQPRRCAVTQFLVALAFCLGDNNAVTAHRIAGLIAFFETADFAGAG